MGKWKQTMRLHGNGTRVRECIMHAKSEHLPIENMVERRCHAAHCLMNAPKQQQGHGSPHSLWAKSPLINSSHALNDNILPALSISLK